ncbi:MAG: phosphate acyltransferase PlsX [Candidatus Dormibacteraceae bacterium]
MQVRIAVDGMGGEGAPAAIVQGAGMAAEELGVEVHVVGTPAAVQPLLPQDSRLRFVPATQVIGMAEHPVEAVRGKQDSSMSVCARLARDGQVDGWVSAGNSGAILAAALLVQGRVKGVERPAIGSVVPTAVGHAYFLDVGANVDCKPQYLEQFAHMGAVYARELLGKEDPRVGLLSNGGERSKGDELVRDAHARIERSHLNFVGNVEGPDIFAGRVDVVVADGFVGNVAVKMAEATADFLLHTLRDELNSSPSTRLGGLLIRAKVQGMRARIDWREFGGGPLLGIDGVAVVAHGRSDARAIRNAIRVARDAVEHGLVAKVREAIGR